MSHQDSYALWRSVTEALSRVRRTLFIAASVLLALASPLASAAQKAYRLTPFSTLDLNLAARYVVRNSGSAGALIHARSDVLDRIVVEEHDDRVRIFVPGNLSDAGEIVIEVDTVALRELIVNGAGSVEGRGFAVPEFSVQQLGAANISMTALDVDKLRVEMQGSGSIEASGRATKERLRIAGAGQYHAADLVADKVDVKIEGAGDVEVMARETLDVHLSGAGSVRYRGDPKLSTNVDGAGIVGRM